MLFRQEHVERYQATDGEEGHEWQGTHALLLTTTGRKSGQKRTTPLIYDPVGDAYAIVASKGGADEPPAWYLNLQANPEVEVQVKADKFTANARTASEEEKAEIWPQMVEQWPAYDEYQASTERSIPIVLLERA